MDTRLISTLVAGLLMGASTLALAGDWGRNVHGAPGHYRDRGDGWSPADRHWDAYRDYRDGHLYRDHGRCHPHGFWNPGAAPAWHYGPPRQHRYWQHGASGPDGVTVVVRGSV